MSIRKADTTREILTAEQLFSDGYSAYLSTTLISTDAVNKTISINMPADGEGILYGRDHLVAKGDVAWLFNTSGADGYYIIDEILSDTIFTVQPPLASSTGGEIVFYYPVGAGTVGFDPTGLTNTHAHNVQDAIRELDSNVVNNEKHEVLRQLIHFLDCGPGHGFASGAYKEIVGGAFPVSITWYVDSTKTKKIFEEIIYRDRIFPQVIIYNMYDYDGITVIQSAKDTITYYNNAFEASRIREFF